VYLTLDFIPQANPLYRPSGIKVGFVSFYYISL